MEKAVYIRQLKRIIKKYHPDLCTDEHLESEYNEITRKLTSILNSLKPGARPYEAVTRGNGPGLVKLKDQDYIYYKLGIRYYKNIHPNRFYKRTAGGDFKLKDYDELISAVKDIYLSFRLSEYYFRKVTEEYPHSPWTADAAAKIRLLKRLYKSYEKIDLENRKIMSIGQFMNTLGLKML